MLEDSEESRMIYPLNLKDCENYPKQKNEHDARWNYELYKFLKKHV